MRKTGQAAKRAVYLQLWEVGLTRHSHIPTSYHEWALLHLLASYHSIIQRRTKLHPKLRLKSKNALCVLLYDTQYCCARAVNAGHSISMVGKFEQRNWIPVQNFIRCEIVFFSQIITFWCSCSRSHRMSLGFILTEQWTCTNIVEIVGSLKTNFMTHDGTTWSHRIIIKSLGFIL